MSRVVYCYDWYVFFALFLVYQSIAKIWSWIHIDLLHNWIWLNQNVRCHAISNKSRKFPFCLLFAASKTRKREKESWWKRFEIVQCRLIFYSLQFHSNPLHSSYIHNTNTSMKNAKPNITIDGKKTGEKF